MPLNLGQVAKAIKDSAAGATKLFSSFKNVDKGIDDIIRWGQNNGFKLTSYKNTEALKKDMPSLFDAYQNRGFNSFKASVQKELGAELTTDEVNYLARHEKQKLWNQDWVGKKSKALEHRNKYVEKFRQDRYNAHQAELKSGADYGGGFSNSELDDLYDSSIGEIVPPSGSGYNKYRAEQLRQQYNANFDAQLNQAEKNLEFKAKNATDPLLSAMSGSGENTPAIAKYKATQSENLNSLLSNTGDESAGYMVSDTVKSTEPVQPQLKFASEQDPRTRQQMSLVEQMRLLKGSKSNTVNNVQDALKNAIDQEEKQAFASGKSLLDKSSENSAWSSTAKAALGTAVVGAGICAALSSNRGQQNNAQLYGQQPLY